MRPKLAPAIYITLSEQALKKFRFVHSAAVQFFPRLFNYLKVIVTVMLVAFKYTVRDCC